MQVGNKLCNTFSPQHYLDTLSSFLDSGYHITPVSDFFHDRIYDKHILLRHDVDMSLDYALDMALLEHDNGIRSTYYILLQSDLYNAMSPQGTDKIREIRRSGAEIGLHVDTRYYTGAIEFTILSNIAQTNVVQWAQHMVNDTPPLPFGLDKDVQNAHKCREAGYKYLSDSAMNWREDCWCTHVDEYDKMEILIHPEWSMYDPTGTASKWEIMNGIAAEGGLQLAKCFHVFEDIVKQYMPTIPSTCGR